jgi:hypothetical protein
MTNTNTNTNLNSIWLGLKKGYQIETLPKNVRTFLELPLVRIFRVIGGICVLFYLLNKNGTLTLNLPYNLNMIIYIIALIQFIQIFIISVWKIIYGINKLLYHKEEFEVRNSPLNRLASMTGHLLYCWKVGCQAASGGLSVLGGSILIDTMLEAAGHDKFFEPVITRGINAMIGTNANKQEMWNLTRRMKSIESAKERHNVLMAEIKSGKESIDSLVNSKIISAEEGQLIKEGFDYLKNSSFEALKKDAAALSSDLMADINKRFGGK